MLLPKKNMSQRQDIRQSPEYAQFMKKIGWRVERVNPPAGGQVFIKKFPLLGSFIKAQRISSPLPFLEIEKIAKKYRAFQIVIEPYQKLRNLEIKKLGESGYKPGKAPFSPTRTSQINLKKGEKEIFKNFSKGRRWDIKKAEKNGVFVRPSEKIEKFIKIKNEKLGILKYFLGRFQSKQIKALWQTFSPKKAALLAAFSQNEMVAGVLLLFYDKVAYYWLAGSTKKGKELGAPSLLVWEAIKLSKKKNCVLFDFEGIKDARYKSSFSWAGFTRFKKSFGGKQVKYPKILVKYQVPFKTLLD